MNKERLKKLPKIELHCHLDGSLSPEFIRKKLAEEIPLFELQAGENCRSLAEYLEKFDLPLRCLQDREGLCEAGNDFMKSVSRENEKYAEVRFAPMQSLKQGLTPGEVIEAVLEGLKRGKKEFQVEYGLIVCAMRHHSWEENRQMLEAARDFLGHGVCAADLAGDEASFPLKNFENLFQLAKELGFPFTIHAGECGDAGNIRDALRFGAGRIGHGIAMKGDKDLQRLCREKQIGIEMCPVSNLQTKASPSPAEYPLREFLDEGLLVTVNTDNRTVSGTAMTRELEFIQKQYHITDEEIGLLMENAIKTAFAGDEVKERLFRTFQKEIKEVTADETV